MPAHIAVGGAGAEMGMRLRPVVEAHDRGDDAVELVGQVDRAGPAAIGAAIMLEHAADRPRTRR